MKPVLSPDCRSLHKILPKLLFAFTVILSLITTCYVSGHYIDSDTSSTLLLSEHLAEIGKLLSQDWYYSTCIEVISTHLAFVPLFRLLDNWQHIRLIGTILLQAFYLLCYAFMLRQAGLSSRVFYISASLLLLPVSVTYGRIVLYHCYYILLLTDAFLMLGLVFRCTKVRNWKKPGAYPALIALGVLSFLGGLGGIRHLMITHAPMVLAAFLFCYLDFSRNGHKFTALFSTDSLRMLFFSVLSAGASFAGFLFNTIYLCERYSFVDYGSTMLRIMDFSQIDELLHGYFHQFGFREGVSMLSATGILSLLGFIAGIYCMYISIQNIKQYKTGDDLPQILLKVFFLFFTSVTVFSFLITAGDGKYHYTLYLSFCLSWIAPMLISSSGHTCCQKGFSLKKIFYWVTILTLCANGLANMTYFNGSKVFDQPYEGLGFQEIDKKEYLSGATDFLTDNGYDIGYATYWEGNVTTEITNGNIRLINIQMDEASGNLVYYNWLTTLYLREQESCKPFILIGIDSQHSFELSDSYPYCTLVYEDPYHCVYDITDIKSFISTLYS